MFKKIGLLIILGVMSMAQAIDIPRYWVQYQMNNMHCTIRLNGVYLYSTIGKSRTVINKTFGHTIGEVLDQGENELEILAHNLADIDLFGVTDEGLKDGYCDVTITASLLNPKSGEEERYEIVNLRATYNDEKELVFSESHSYGDKSLSENYYTEPYEPNYSPDGTQAIKRLLGKRQFKVNHSQPFSWTKAEPFEDTLENRQKLWAVYNQIRTAIQQKDMTTLRELLEPGITELADYEGSNVRRHFQQQVELAMSDFIGLKLQYWGKPNFEDYELKLYARSKLFQLVEKNTFNASPIFIEKPRVRTLNPVFTYVNGKIGVAWF